MVTAQWRKEKGSDEALWYGMVDQVRIGGAGEMRFIFKDGTVVEG